MSWALISQFLILTAIVSGVLIFFLKKILFDSTQGAVNRLNKETEGVRTQQVELNEKIKAANEELKKRRAEADALVAKMNEAAQEQARKEREELFKKARVDGEEIIIKAQQTKEAMRKELEKEMKVKSIDFTVFMLAELFSEKTRESLHDSLTAEFLENLLNVDMEMIQEDVKTAEIISTLPFSEKFQKRLAEILMKKLGRKVEIKTQEDKVLVAGVILKFGGLSLDGSFIAMLKEKAEDVKDRIERGLIKI